MDRPESFDHRLGGCTSTPLASYLKALGILRLISSPENNLTGQGADPHARGWWENECFHLRTVLSREALQRFFLEEYAPSPIIAPWNGRAGFLEGDDQERSTRTGAGLMFRFETCRAARFANMSTTVKTLRSNVDLARYNDLRTRVKEIDGELKSLTGDAKTHKAEKKKKTEKEADRSKRRLLPTLRSNTTSTHLLYIDACYVLSNQEIPMPLLGAGGSDGSREFGVNFAEALTQLFELDDGSATAFNEQSLEGAFLGGGQLFSLGII